MSERKRAGRNIKLNVTDEISHMGISKEDYAELEKFYDNQDEELLTPAEENIINDISKMHNIDFPKLRAAIIDFKIKEKEHTGKVI